jgi:uncharacterized protein
MDLETAKKVIENSIINNLTHASFVWHGGEPLLVGIDYFKEIVNYQNELLQGKKQEFSIENNIQTNALLLNEDWINFFKYNNFRVSISVDGFYEIQSKNRGTTLNHFKKIINNIELMHKLQLDFSVLTVVTDETLGKEEALFDFFSETGISSFGFLPMNYGNLSDCLKPEDYGNFLCNFFDIWLSKGKTGISIREFDDYIRWHLGQHPIQCEHCNICHQYFTVQPNGDLYPCDCFGQKGIFKLGTIFDDVNTTIKNNKRIYSSAESLPKECNSCQFSSLCKGGCKYFRYIQNNSFDNRQYYCSSYKQLYKKMKQALELFQSES